MKRARVAAAVVAAGLAALVAIVALVPGAASTARLLLEPRDAEVRTVTGEEDLRAAFDAHADRIRVVAWLSPT